MRGTRASILVLPVLLGVAVLGTPIAAGAPQPKSPPAPEKPIEDADVEVKCIDSSSMKLKLLDDKLELATKHGVLRIAVTDIRRIEFATRVSPAIAEKVLAAIGKLNHPDFKVRETATEELKRYRSRAYPQLVKSLKTEDPEVRQRVEDIIKYIRDKVPASVLENREFDVVHTDDSKITGRLTAEYLRVETSQFGEQKLKLYDALSLRTGAAVDEEQPVAATPAPATLITYQNQFGKELVFSVTGAAPGANPNQPNLPNQVIWGTDQYTLDSHLPTAVVHAGFAKPGETVTVRVRIVQPPAQFAASNRHGVTSLAFGPYPAGAYMFIKK